MVFRRSCAPLIGCCLAWLDLTQGGHNWCCVTFGQNKPHQRRFHETRCCCLGLVGLCIDGRWFVGCRFCRTPTRQKVGSCVTALAARRRN